MPVSRRGRARHGEGRLEAAFRAGGDGVAVLALLASPASPSRRRGGREGSRGDVVESRHFGGVLVALGYKFQPKCTEFPSRSRSEPATSRASRPPADCLPSGPLPRGRTLKRVATSRRRHGSREVILGPEQNDRLHSARRRARTDDHASPWSPVASASFPRRSASSPQAFAISSALPPLRTSTNSARSSSVNVFACSMMARSRSVIRTSYQRSRRRGKTTAPQTTQTPLMCLPACR